MLLSYYFILLLACSSHAIKHVMYLTGQHNVVPEPDLITHITHVALAFMPSSNFNEVNHSTFPLFASVESVRSQFSPGTAIMVAIGGWGDTEGFSKAAASEDGRILFAKNVKAMIDFTGADGVDIDWEYPGGNGEDYKRILNSQKAWEIEAYPKLLSEIRTTLGPTKLMSAAVPGLPRDMLAFTSSTIPAISVSLDFFNIMTYDLMNRRDSVTKHHTGIAVSLDAIDTYLENGLQPHKANLGFAFYIKWFRTLPEAGCDKAPLGCKTALMEDPITGDDLGNSGQFAWCDDVPMELMGSFRRAMREGKYDYVGGGHSYFDMEDNLFWSWDTPEVIREKVPNILEDRNLGGVFAWGLGEDGTEWIHLKALNEGLLDTLSRVESLDRDEL